ncbi:MAG: hypothetical protein E6G46_07570 [Actinobacteria bacterium]|nr:MAG: hypothetical protein E6G46_07570 [Actinomycetota bacterium]
MLRRGPARRICHRGSRQTAHVHELAEATAIADTGRAIATGLDQVRAALEQAGVSRDPIKLAKKDINVQAIGSSGVLKLSVTDKNPTVARELADALATQVVTTRLRVARSQPAQTLTQIQQRLAELDANIATLQGEIQGLTARIARAGSAATVAALTQTRSQTQSVLDLLVAQRTSQVRGPRPNRRSSKRRRLH